jgi:hypothetical protein
MKTKNRMPFNMNERSKKVAYKIMAIMYLLTILSMQGKRRLDKEILDWFLLGTLKDCVN